MRIRFIWTVLFFLIYNCPAFSQRTILGKILDENTKEPINGVLVRLGETDKITSSNFRGYFQFEVDTSQYLLFERTGYFDAKLEMPDQDKFQVYLKPLEPTKPDPPKLYYRGGLDAYNRHLAKNLGYPEEARRKGIAGKFYARVEIDNAGYVKHVEVLNTEGDIGGIDSEIKRVLFSLPEPWISSDSTKSFVASFSFKLDGNDNTVYSNKKGPIDVNEMNEIIVRAFGTPNSLPPSQNKGMEGQGIINSGLNNVDIIPKDVAFSLRDAYSNQNKTKLVLKNKSLDDFRYLSKTLDHVKYLDVEGNELIELPKQLELLPMLEELYAPFNKLTSLPEEFSKLKKLKKMGLGDNRFEQFPQELYELDQLEVLDFGKNNIEYIGEEISQMKNLKVLILSKNKLRSLPSSIMEMKNLEVLNIKGNKVSEVEIEELKGALYGVTIIY